MVLAKVNGHIIRSVQSPLSCRRRRALCAGSAVFLKREDEQPVFSFKLRGA
eukprot:gene41844-21792_t